jgi:hypothetical protein
MEFDRDPEEGLEFQEEAWDNEAELREDEDAGESEGWVPEGYTEILVPELMAHHCELLVAVAKTLLGVLLQPCDRVVRLVADDLDWARELVKNVAEVLTMCWSAARTDGYPEGHPDALKQASKHLEWAISNGVVSWEELTNAYWLSVLHSSPGAGDSPEDKMFWGMARRVGALRNRPAPIGSEPTDQTHGDPDENGIKPVVFVDTTFDMRSSWFPREERIDSMTVKRYEWEDPRRAVFWFKEIEGKEFSFFVPEGMTENALFNIVRGLEEPVTKGNSLWFKIGPRRVEVSINRWSRVCVKIPSVDLLMELAEMDEGLGDIVKLVQLTLGRRDRTPAWRQLIDQLSNKSFKTVEAVGRIISGLVGPVEIRIKGKLADEWAALLPAPPVNQLPPLVMVCRQCSKTAGVVYADGLCPACHRSANPL